jgi:23S rRNA pseudouridine2605 synthase
MRIQKFLSLQGICSRREAEKWISEGRVQVNGVRVTNLALSVDPGSDRISVDGKAVKVAHPEGMKKGSTAPLVYWMLNKPAGFSLERSPGGDSIHHLPRLARLSFKVTAANALGKNAEGLCLLTNDHEFAGTFRGVDGLEHVVLVMVDRRLEEEELKSLLPEKTPGRPRLKIEYRHKAKLGASYGYWYFVRGDIPGMKRKLDSGLKRLKLKTHKYVQLSLAGLELPETLKSGDYVQLSSSDIRKLKSIVRKQLAADVEK